MPWSHLFPQAPQLLESSDTFVHTPLHKVLYAGGDPGGGHAEHAPFTQASPVAQVLPQAPQFASSLAVLVHVPLQSVCPHTQLQLAPTHV